MPQTNQRATSTDRAAGLFDLRFFIAALFGIYGPVLIVMGAAGPSQAELAKAGGWNVNLWCGIAMLSVAALFAGWALCRPVRVPDAAWAVEAEPVETQPA